MEDLQEVSLSNHDIMNKLDGKANLMTYEQLMDYNTLDEALGKNGALVLLYETEDGYGHWCCVFKRGGLVEHFDSYGLKPDDELKYIPKYFREEKGITRPHLTSLFYKSPYKISYNEHKLQSKKDDMNTCGRWVIARLLLRHVPLTRFKNYFKKKPVSPDDIVTAFTEVV